jgi:hypothetical protein
MPRLDLTLNLIASPGEIRFFIIMRKINCAAGSTGFRPRAHSSMTSPLTESSRLARRLGPKQLEKYVLFNNLGVRTLGAWSLLT